MYMGNLHGFYLYITLNNISIIEFSQLLISYLLNNFYSPLQYYYRIGQHPHSWISFLPYSYVFFYETNNKIYQLTQIS